MSNSALNRRSATTLRGPADIPANSPMPATLSTKFSLIALVLVVGLPVTAQRRPAPRGGAEKPVSADSAAAMSAPAGSNRLVSQGSINFPRAVADSIRDLRALSAPKPKGIGNQLLGAVRRTAVGDQAVVDAARLALARQVQSTFTDPRTTHVVVIGSADDAMAVTASLADVTRKTKVVLVDKELVDDDVDNAILSRGVAGRVADQLNNVWVFLPRRGRTIRDRPDHELPVRGTKSTVWNGIFAGDGDAINLNQLQSTVRRDSARGTTAAAPPQADAGAGFTLGDVVVPKIAGMKIYAAPSSSSTVVGNSSTADEFVVDGAPVNGMVKVAGNLSGWVNTALLKKKS